MTITNMLVAGSRCLRIACGFQLDHHFTIAVYEAYQGEEGRYFLKCIAHDRARTCSLDNARAWPEGVGVGGVCFASNAEILVPDITMSAFPTTMVGKPEDLELYRSLVAVPISSPGGARPWGVVIGTNNQALHFDEERGPSPTEGIRALATMVSLAVADSALPTAK